MTIIAIDQISGQAQKEPVVNGLFAAARPALGFGKQMSATSGLTWGIYGGVMLVAGARTWINNQTITQTASATNWLYLTSAGVLTKATSAPTGWPDITSPAGAIALFKNTVGANTVTTEDEDWRLSGGIPGATGAAGANWSLTVNAQTGTTYTLVTGDNGKVITLSNASAITVTVPSGLGANFACELIQIGAGQVNVVASGVTLNAFGSLTHFAGQHAAATLVAYVADVFNLSGNLV